MKIILFAIFITLMISCGPNQAELDRREDRYKKQIEDSISKALIIKQIDDQIKFNRAEYRADSIQNYRIDSLLNAKRKR